MGNWWTSFWSAVSEVGGLIKARFAAKNTAPQRANAEASVTAESKEKANADLGPGKLDDFRKDVA